VSGAEDDIALVERVRITEHFLVVEHVPARMPERRARPREPEAQREMEAA
jgi:hypothetical protein